MKPAVTAQELTKALRGRVCRVRREQPVWHLEFGDDLSVFVACLWRLVGPNGLKTTSEDDGQLFGLPAPQDAEEYANQLLLGQTVREVTVSTVTCDLVINFGNGLRLEVLATSAGHEAWEMWLNGGLIVGQGGVLL